MATRKTNQTTPAAKSTMQRVFEETVAKANARRRIAEAKVAALLDLMDIQKVEPRSGSNRNCGTWVSGTIDGYWFQALVFPEHAECESYELGDSRISKLFVGHRLNRTVAANFDRGWDTKPKPGTRVAKLVDAIAAGLANTIFAD